MVSAPVDDPRAPEVSASDDDPGEPTSAPPRRLTARRVAFALLAVLLLLLVVAGWLAFRGYQAGTALLSAQDVVTEVQDDVAAGDTDQLQARLPGLRADLATARTATADPVWRLAENLPWAGANLEAVRVVTVSLDDVVRDALPALQRVDDVLAEREAPDSDGRIDLAPLLAAAPDIVSAAAGAHRAQEAVDAIDTDALVPQLVGPVEQLQVGMRQVAGALDAGAQVATLLPPMLGADGPRSYLLVSLNSAELRSAGGIVGAFAVLHAQDGAVSLTDQRSTIDLKGIDTPILPLTDEELALDTDRLGRWVQDAVITPDFPRSAQLLAARWAQDTGQTVDGVIATDPVGARYVLEATGPVTEPGGSTITAVDLLQVLLRDAYRDIADPAAADTFYAGVAASIFRAVGAGQGDQQGLVTALARAGSEGRIRLWSVHPQEQATLVRTTIGAAFLSGDFPDAVGVFLNDGTAGKLGYYLTTKVTVEDLQCTGPEPTATVRLDLAYDPPDDLSPLPVYVTGPATAARPVGVLSTNVTVYAPVGSPLQDLRLDEGYVGGLVATQSGRDVESVTSLLEPGASETYRVAVPVHDGTVSVWTTPTLTSPGFVTATC